MLKITALSFLSLVLIFGERGTLGATLLTEDFTELLGLSQLVVEVEVSGVEPGDTHAGIPRSIYALQVRKTFKGNQALKEIRAEALGGTSGDQRVVVPGQVNLAIGDKAIMMLTKSDPAQTTWRIIGGEAGHLILEQDQDGSPLVRRAAGVFDYYQHDARSATGFAHYTENALGGELFDNLIQAVISTGKPVIAALPATTATHLIPATPETNNSISEILAAFPVKKPQDDTSLLTLSRMLMGAGLVAGIWLVGRQIKA